MDQPTIVFTPSTPTMSAILVDHDIEDLPPIYSHPEVVTTSRRQSFCRSFSSPMVQLEQPRQPVILHRPRSSSSITAHWSLTRARNALLESCWGSGSNSRAAVAMGMMETHAVKERRSVTARDTSPWVAGREKGSWYRVDGDDEDDSEPETSPSTPVFARHSDIAATRQSPQCITLMSTLVIALALAALAFTTFFHPTFGDSISKLPVSSTTDVKASFGEQGRMHRFLHFDELFGHSDDDGLVGIATSMHSVPGSDESVGELRKRGLSAFTSKEQDATISTSHQLPNAYLRSAQINHTARTQKRWNPWHAAAAAFGPFDTEGNDAVVNDHRRALGRAEERLMRRRQAIAQGKTPQRRR